MRGGAIAATHPCARHRSFGTGLPRGDDAPAQQGSRFACAHSEENRAARLHEQGEEDAGDKEARLAVGGRQDGDQPDPDVERALQHGVGICADGGHPRGAIYWGQVVRETGTTIN